jgi:hypothetical protein
MGRFKRHGTIGAHVAPTQAVALTGEHQRVIFTLIVDLYAGAVPIGHTFSIFETVI